MSTDQQPTITDFLLARITEDEAYAKQAQGERYGWVDLWDVTTEQGSATNSVIMGHAFRLTPARVLRECAAKRAIIEQHEAWPVLVEQDQPEFRTNMDSTESIAFHVSRNIAWLTEQEYVKRFGVEPPTAPMIRTLAAIYSDHPDYRPEWALDG